MIWANWKGHDPCCIGKSISEPIYTGRRRWHLNEVRLEYMHNQHWYTFTQRALENLQIY